MQIKDRIRERICFLIGLLGCIMLTGCSGKDLQVTIRDGNT